LRLRASSDPYILEIVETVVAEIERLVRSQNLGTEALLTQFANAFDLAKSEISDLTAGHPPD
jgi:hypothetical protein